MANPAIGAAIAIGGAFVDVAGYYTFTGIGAYNIAKGAKEMAGAAREYNAENPSKESNSKSEDRSIIGKASDTASKFVSNAKDYAKDFKDFRNSRRN